jgi:flagellar biosynthesis chaperone FliJ
MQKTIESTTTNRWLWGVLLVAAIGLSAYAIVALTQRQLSPLQDQIQQLSQNVTSQNSDLSKLKSTENVVLSQTQLENISGQLKELSESVQAQQKELENLKNQMEQSAKSSQPFVQRLEALETANADLHSSVDELEVSMENISQEFAQRQQALERILGPVLVIDNPMPYNTSCPAGYAALEIIFQIWSANTELDRLHDLNRDRLICKPASLTPTLMLPSISQTVNVYDPEEDRAGPGGLR